VPWMDEEWIANNTFEEVPASVLEDLAATQIRVVCLPIGVDA